MGRAAAPSRALDQPLGVVRPCCAFSLGARSAAFSAAKTLGVVSPGEQRPLCTAVELAVFAGALGEGNGTPLQYSCLENPMDGGAWWSPRGRNELDTTEQLRFHFGEGNGNPLQYSCLENPMDGEPGRLQSMGQQRVRHDCETSSLHFT